MPNETVCNYSVFGLSLQSNLSIPGLHEIKSGSPLPPIGIQLGIAPSAKAVQHEFEEPFYTSSFLGPDKEPALRIWEVAGGAMLHLLYCDGMEFWVDRAGENIWGTWPDTLSICDAATYLLGPVLGLLLRLRGATCLHASAVAVGHCAFAFAGPAGAGKSTTAAALARRGLPVLSDDIVALSEQNGQFEVLPAFPFLSLWPESAKVLYGREEALPRFLPTWEKRCLASGSHGLRFEDRSLVLGAVYILGDRQETGTPRVEALSTEESLLALISSSYATNILDADLRAKEFRVLSRLVERIRIRRIWPTTDIRHLDMLCGLIQEDVCELRAEVKP